jgi:signal transduction histidine kinase
MADAIARESSSDAEYRRLEALYRVRAEANKACTRARGRPDFLQQLVEIVAGFGCLKLAWIGLLQDDGKLSLTAFEGEAREYAVGLDLTPDRTVPQGSGPAGIAMRTGRPVVCNDFQNDPITTHWHERARRYDIRASLAYPLRTGGETLGLLSVYSGIPGHFGPRELDLFADLANDIVAGLEWIAQSEALRIADARLRTALASLTEVERATRSGAFRLSIPDGAAWWSQGVTSLFGLAANAGLDDVLAHVAPPVRRLVEEAGRDALARGESLKMDVPVATATGERRWFELFATPERRPNGTFEVSGLIRDVDERRRLQRAVDEAGARERARLAADLHDELGQVLTSLGLLTHTLGRRAREIADPKHLADVERLERIVDHARVACRELAHNYAVTTTPAALLPRLERLADEVADPIRCTVRIASPLPEWLDAGAVDELFHCAQEAVANALKHARARTIAIEITVGTDDLTLTVDDDGVGMAERPAAGLGIASIRARATRLGGYARFERGPAGGVRVLVRAVRPE